MANTHPAPSDKDIVDTTDLKELLAKEKLSVTQVFVVGLKGFKEIMDLPIEELTDKHQRAASIYAKYFGCASTIARSMPSLFKKGAASIPVSEVLRARGQADLSTGLSEKESSQYRRAPRPADA